MVAIFNYLSVPCLFKDLWTQTCAFQSVTYHIQNGNNTKSLSKYFILAAKEYTQGSITQNAGKNVLRLGLLTNILKYCINSPYNHRFYNPFIFISNFINI